MATLKQYTWETSFILKIRLVFVIEVYADIYIMLGRHSYTDKNSSHNPNVSQNRQEIIMDSALFYIENGDSFKRLLYSYDCFTSFQFFNKVLLGQARNISKILNLSVKQTLYLLINFNWSSKRLMGKYWEEYLKPDNKFLVDIGITTFNEDILQGRNTTLGVFKQKKDGWACPVCCFDDIPGSKAFSLQCGHSFCEDCYQNYARGKIIEGCLIRCPQPDCPLVMQFEDFDILFPEDTLSLSEDIWGIANNSEKSIIKKKRKWRRFHKVSFGVFLNDDIVRESSVYSEPKNESMATSKIFEEVDGDMFLELINYQSNSLKYSTKMDYINYISKKYIESDNNQHWCPAPDCPFLIRVNEHIPGKEELFAKVTQIPVVSCLQNHFFCVNCNCEMHYPVPCEVAKMWLQTPELLATTSWIKLNTKACPLCKILIEKNEGCNHMTCRSCQHQFCWVCMGPWKVHGTSYYECNNSSNFHVKPGKYNNKDVKERPTQYVHSFEVRQASINALCIIHERIFDEIELLQTTKKIKWGEGQALKKSISQFINVESTLRWSYVFLYFLKDDRNKSRLEFEEQQDKLCKSVEDLSKYFNFENPCEIIYQRAQFIREQDTCVSIQLNLIILAEKNLLNDTLVFDIDSTIAQKTKTQSEVPSKSWATVIRSRSQC